jgi:hypothetical protein
MPLQSRLVAGRFVMAVGAGLLLVWTYYYLTLLRPIDWWDASPLPVAVAVFLIGAKLARYRFENVSGPLLSAARASLRRRLAAAFMAGGLIEFVLWLFRHLAVTEGPATIDGIIWLDRSQRPAYTIGMAVYRSLYRSVGRGMSVWLGSVCASALLIAMWSVVAFAILTVIRVTAQENSK